MEILIEEIEADKEVRPNINRLVVKHEEGTETEFWRKVTTVTSFNVWVAMEKWWSFVVLVENDEVAHYHLATEGGVLVLPSNRGRSVSE